MNDYGAGRLISKGEPELRHIVYFLKYAYFILHASKTANGLTNSAKNWDLGWIVLNTIKLEGSLPSVSELLNPVLLI